MKSNVTRTHLSLSALSGILQTLSDIDEVKRKMDAKPDQTLNEHALATAMAADWAAIKRQPCQFYPECGCSRPGGATCLF